MMRSAPRIAELVAQVESSSKKRRTRELLVGTALALFLEKGYDQVTVEDIAGTAGVSLRTLFRYYPTKESLALAFHHFWLSRFREVLEADGSKDIVAQWRAHVAESSASLKGAEREYLAYAIFMDTPGLRYGIDRIVSEYRELIAEASARARDRSSDDDLYSHILAGLLTSTNAVVTRRFIRSGGREKIEELFPQSVDYAMTLFRRED